MIDRFTFNTHTHTHKKREMLVNPRLILRVGLDSKRVAIRVCVFLARSHVLFMGPTSTLFNKCNF